MMNRFRIADFGLRIVLALVCAAEICCAQQCYVDPITGLRTCPSRDYGWRPADEFNPQSEIPGTPWVPKSFDASAHCRITVGDGSTGSGTLVHRNESTGLVLTCSHLFNNATANIVVAFPGGKRFVARLLQRDRANELAALLIRRPDAEPLAAGDEEPAGQLWACGYGQAGQFRRVSGNIIGQATVAGAAFPSLVIGCAVRPGDSGGGVLDTAGRLVGVVWGERDGTTYATCGRPVREFLDRVMGQGSRVKSREPDALSPQSPAPSPQLDWQAWSNEIEARIKSLDDKKQDKGDYLRPGDLNGYLSRKELPDPANLATRDDVTSVATESTSRLESLREHLHTRISESRPGLFAGLSFGKLIVGALGLSGPLAAAVIVAAGLAGRRVKRLAATPTTSWCPELPASKAERGSQRPIAIDTPPLPQRTVPETHYVPYEKDSFAKAHQWASEQVARKYPGATEVLQAQDSLIKQHLAGQK